MLKLIVSIFEEYVWTILAGLSKFDPEWPIELWAMLTFFTSLFILRTFNLVISNVATLYNVFFATILFYNYFALKYNYYTYVDIIGLGQHLDVGVVKILVVIFWCFFINYLRSTYEKEYFKDGAEKLYAIDIACFGGIVLVIAKNVLDVFIGLELLAFPSYMLISSDKKKSSVEGAIKYLLFSVLATLSLILGFILIFITNGEPDVNTGIFYTSNSTSAKIGFVLYILGFFIKIGVGPLFQWAPPVYQASSAAVFVFISTIIKIPMLIPFSHLAKSDFNLPGNDNFFFVVAILVFGIVVAAESLFVESDIRRILAFATNINLATATLGYILGEFNQKLYFSFLVLYFLSNVALFQWHFANASNDITMEEVTRIKSFPNESPFAVFILGLTTLLNSGLPPATLFILKFSAIGNIKDFNPINFKIDTFYLIIIVIICNIVTYYAYFRILKYLAYRDETKVPKDHYQEFVKNKNAVYVYALGTTVFTIVIFILVINSTVKIS